MPHVVRDVVQSSGEIHYPGFVQDSFTASPPLSILNPIFTPPPILNGLKVADFPETLDHIIKGASTFLQHFSNILGSFGQGLNQLLKNTAEKCELWVPSFSEGEDNYLHSTSGHPFLSHKTGKSIMRFHFSISVFRVCAVCRKEGFLLLV